MDDKVGKKTGEKTKVGRDVYKTPEGESVSEKSVTIKFGENAYVNAPSIHDGIKYSEDEVKQMLLDGKIKPTSRHDTLEEALKAAKSRSKSLMNVDGIENSTQKQMQDMLKRMEERDAATPENRERDIEMLKETASDVAETFTPYGDYLTGKEAVEDFKRGDYGSAALGAAATAVGLIPGVGDVAAKALDIGINPLLKGGEFLKNYNKNITDDLFLKSRNATAGNKNADKLINKSVDSGKQVGIRLNLNSKIPDAEKGLDKLQTIHDKNFNGKALSYVPYATVENVTFNVSQKGRQGIAAKINQLDVPEAKNKYPAMSVDGNYNPDRNVLDELDDDVVEIGFNPKNLHLFVDMKTGQAVEGADVATVVGDRVYAKGVRYMKKTDAPEPLKASDGTELPSDVRYKFKKGGTAMPMKEQMSVFEDGGLMDQGGTVDPVSGNDVPTGSMQKEVRDDIPAQISVGEYVIPADVVRFYGIKFFEELRMGAKEGMQLLKAKGQVGNGDEQVVPDDVPFEMADLVLGNDDEEGMEFNPGGFVNPYGVYQQKQVPVVTVPSAFQAQAAPQVTSQQQYDAKPVFPAQAVQPQVGQRRPVFSVQDLFPKTQKETTKEEDPVEETKVETAQVLDKELGDGGQSSADKAESDQFDRDLALSSIEAGIDGLSVKDGKFSFDSALDLGPLGTIAGFLPGPIGTGIGLAGAIGKGNASSGLTAIGQTLSEMGFNTTGINSVGSSVSGIAGLVQSGVNSDFSKEVEKGLAEYAKANNITIDQAFAQVSKTARARAIALAGDPTGGLGGGYSSDPTGTGVSGYVDPVTGAVSAFGPAGSFKDLAMTNPQEAVNVAKNQDIFSKAIFDLEEADVTGTGVTAGQVAAEEAMGLDPFGGTGDPDPEQGNEPGNVDTEGGVAEGIYNKGGFISKRKMRRQKAKDKRKGLATRK